MQQGCVFRRLYFMKSSRLFHLPAEFLYFEPSVLSASTTSDTIHTHKPQYHLELQTLAMWAARHRFKLSLCTSGLR